MLLSTYRKEERKGGASVLREIHSDYVMPVGVWQIREGIIQALKKENRQFESFKNALSFACMNLSGCRKEWIINSKIYKYVKEQMRITDFFGNNNNATRI